MTSEIVVRQARAADGEVVGRLTEQVYRDGGFGDDGYAVVLRDGATRVREAHVLVAELDGRVVGTVTVAQPGTAYAGFSQAGEVEVRMLAVADAVRRRGVADRLMDEAEDHARRAGADAVVLSTEPLMHAAHRLYQRRGYVRTPERDRWEGTAELLAYRLDLR